VKLILAYLLGSLLLSLTILACADKPVSSQNPTPPSGSTVEPVVAPPGHTTQSASIYGVWRLTSYNCDGHPTSIFHQTVEAFTTSEDRYIHWTIREDGPGVDLIQGNNSSRFFPIIDSFDMKMKMLS
jgi:hypothetical protein